MDLSKDGEMDISPKIKCGVATNGILNVTITNIDLFWEMEPLYQWEDLCFKVCYRSVTNAPSTNSNPSHHEIDAIWRFKYILFANVPDDGVFYFKVSTYLNDYNFEFKIGAFNEQTSLWMKPSDVFTIKIPSFLKNNQFAVGQKVSFRDTQSGYSSSGAIVLKLDANNYCVKDLNGDEHNINISQLYHDSIPDKYQCNFIALHKRLLMQRNDDTVNVFDALYDVFEDLSIDSCVTLYGVMEATTNWEAMCQFITTNVFQFLYEAQFEYKVDCLLNGTQHNALEMMNIWQHDIERKREYMKRDKTKDYNTVNIIWSCDWCRSEMGPWQYAFRCSDCRQEICASCVNTVINLNGELIELLSGLLFDDLITDIIQNIVDFVIGRVLIKELEHAAIAIDKHSVNHVCDTLSCKRRKTDDWCLPPRWYHQKNGN